MKLKQSMTEREIWDELVELQRVFSEHIHHRGILQALRTSFGENVGFIALDLFPDGGNEFLELLVNNSVVVELDVPITRDGDVAIIRKTPLKSYMRGKSRVQQIRLAVAVDILKS